MTRSLGLINLYSIISTWRLTLRGGVGVFENPFSCSLI